MEGTRGWQAGQYQLFVSLSSIPVLKPPGDGVKSGGSLGGSQSYQSRGTTRALVKGTPRELLPRSPSDDIVRKATRN